MRNFKKIIQTMACIAVLVLVLAGLDFALYPCTFIRNDIHMVTSKQRDVIIFGTSHGKMGIDPDSMLEQTGLTGHNLCVGGEYPIDCYYLMKLIMEKQAPKTVIFELDSGYFTTKKEEGNNYLLFYHEFPMSKVKMEYFFAAMPECDFRTAFFPSYEYSLLYEIPNIKNTVKQKIKKDYDASKLKSKTQEYHENGFIERYPVMSSDFKPYKPETFSSEDVYEPNIEYMSRLISLCRENDIDFKVVIMPLPDETLRQNKDSFDEADRYFSEYFKNKGVEYYNFNKEYYDVCSHELSSYTDYDGHMNGDSARKFSRTLGDIIFK